MGGVRQCILNGWSLKTTDSAFHLKRNSLCRRPSDYLVQCSQFQIPCFSCLLPVDQSKSVHFVWNTSRDWTRIPSPLVGWEWDPSVSWQKNFPRFLWFPGFFGSPEAGKLESRKVLISTTVNALMHNCQPNKDTKIQQELGPMTRVHMLAAARPIKGS